MQLQAPDVNVTEVARGMHEACMPWPSLRAADKLRSILFQHSHMHKGRAYLTAASQQRIAFFAHAVQQPALA